VLAQTSPVTFTLPEGQATYEVFDIPDVPLEPDTLRLLQSHLRA
jgi:hypothetical protein